MSAKIETHEFQAETRQLRIETDGEERNLTIHDNGNGMSRSEVVASIGTIASNRAVRRSQRPFPAGGLTKSPLKKAVPAL